MFNCEDLAQGQQGIDSKGVRIEALVLPGQRINIFDRPDPNVRALSPREYLDEEKPYLTELFARLYYGKGVEEVEESGLSK